LRWKETEWTKERDAIGCDTLGPVGLIDKLGGNRSNGTINSQQHAPAAARGRPFLGGGGDCGASARRIRMCQSTGVKLFLTFLTVTELGKDLLGTPNEPEVLSTGIWF